MKYYQNKENNSTKPNKGFLGLGCWAVVLIPVFLIVGIYFSLAYWASVSVPDYYIFNSVNPWGKRIDKVNFAFTDKGPVFWIHSYYSGGGKTSAYHNYQLDIVNPETRTLIKKIPFDQTTSIVASSSFSDFDLLEDNRFFIASEFLRLQFRDPYSGDIVEDEQAFCNRFKELKGGISEVKSSQRSYHITAKDGFKYWYIPAYGKLVTEEFRKNQLEIFDRKELDSTSKEVVLKYVWGLEGDIRKQLYLVCQYRSIYDDQLNARDLQSLKTQIKENEAYFQKESLGQTEADKSRQMFYSKNPKLKQEMDERREKDRQGFMQRTIKQQKLVCSLEEKIFLEAHIIYQDKDLCVVLHNTEVGGTGNNVLTCVDQKGKIRWELDNIPTKVLQKSPYQDKNFSFSQVSGVRKENELAVINDNFMHHSVCAFDLNTGELLWEYNIWE